MFKKIAAFFLSFTMLLTGAFFGGKNVNEEVSSLIRPDTWAMTDGLGRTLSLKGDVKEKDDSKFVGLFYWTWHTNFGSWLEPQNATEILSAHPGILYDFDSPYWMPDQRYPDGRPYFWDEPLWGYYLDNDEYILRKNAQLIADAGVDVILFDCTNGTSTWDESCLKLFEVFQRAKADGVNVPKMAYILPFSADEDSTTSLKHLYNDIYSKGLYKDLWFMWDGKPLIMAHSSQLRKTDGEEKAILDFFTFRKNEPTYFAGDKTYLSKTWGWCSSYPQTKYDKSLNGHIEQMCVSVAQNAADGQLCAMSDRRDTVQGRSFTKGNYSYSYTCGGKTIKVDKNIENSEFYGLNFQQQWDHAIECDPDFIFVTGWNEWIAGRWKEWEGTPNAFPDQFSPEFSRDCEPTKGILKDHYYCQLCENIRRFKGISDEVTAVDGVKTYYDYTGDTPRRDCDGWVGTHYTNDTMRNDFVSAKVSDDGKNIFITVETKDDIIGGGDGIRIFIDTDTSGVSPNWEGFEYVINRNGRGEDKVIVEKSTGGWSFEQTGSASYTVSGKEMKLTVPVSALGLGENVKFNFKLADNTASGGDVMEFYTNGDTAPDARFTYVY